MFDFGWKLFVCINSLCILSCHGIQVGNPVWDNIVSRVKDVFYGNHTDDESSGGGCSGTQVNIRIARSLEQCAAHVASNRWCGPAFYYCPSSLQCTCQKAKTYDWNCENLDKKCRSARLTQQQDPQDDGDKFSLEKSPEAEEPLSVTRTLATGARPHILMIILDDLGFAEVGFNRPSGTTGIPTPHIDALANNGIVLDRHYAHKFCSPTRSAIQSGRAPIHVNVLNLGGYARNPDDDVSGFAGMPTKMTGVAEVMKRAGYSTHMVGKWDAGMTVSEQLPQSRGYDTSLIYFEHGNDCWTYASDINGCGQKFDLWEHDQTTPYPGRPALRFANSVGCKDGRMPASNGRCVYEDAVFKERVLNITQEHDTSTPLFLVWATHAVHGPYQPPVDYLRKAEHYIHGLKDAQFRKYAWNKVKYYGSLMFVDDAIGEVTSLLHSKGMYQNSFIVFMSDNGGVMGMDNTPLKGSKFANWEGGIRVCAFVSGGFLPVSVRGTRRAGLVAAWDWYSTFAYLGGVDHTDEKAALAGLPEVDSINMWHFLSEADGQSPRDVVEIGSTQGDPDMVRLEGEPVVGGLIRQLDGKLYKLVIGDITGDLVQCAAYSGPAMNHTEQNAELCDDMTQVCGRTSSNGCLFDLSADPAEMNNLAASLPSVYDQLMAETQSHTVFKPNRGSTRVSSGTCDMLVAKYGAWLGPQDGLLPAGTLPIQGLKRNRALAGDRGAKPFGKLVED